MKKNILAGSALLGALALVATGCAGSSGRRQRRRRRRRRTHHRRLRADRLGERMAQRQHRVDEDGVLGGERLRARLQRGRQRPGGADRRRAQLHQPGRRRDRHRADRRGRLGRRAQGGSGRRHPGRSSKTAPSPRPTTCTPAGSAWTSRRRASRPASGPPRRSATPRPTWWCSRARPVPHPPTTAPRASPRPSRAPAIDDARLADG